MADIATNLSVTQYSPGFLTANYSFSALSTYQFSIFAADDSGRWWEKDSGNTDTTVRGEIEFSEFGTYDIKLEIYDPVMNGQVVQTLYTTVDIVDADSPEAAIVAEQIGYTLSASVRWRAYGLSGWGTVSYEISALFLDTDDDADYRTVILETGNISGTGTRSTTLTFPNYGWWWLNVYLYDSNGNRIGSNFLDGLIFLENGPKPDQFSWTYRKTQGRELNLTAAEWNSFTERINEAREYYGREPYSFTEAVTGKNFTAAMFNEAIEAIETGTNTYVSLWYDIYPVSRGDKVTAAYLNGIVEALNGAIE